MRIYVACLASYNNGVLYGRWIDASSDVDEMQEQVNAMLRESKFPNVMVTCPECEGAGKPYGFGDSVCEACGGKGKVPSAEEWAIHDYEDMPSTFGEYSGLQAIADYAEFVDQIETTTGLDGEAAQDLAKAMLENWHDVKGAQDALDRFVTVCDTFRDYSDELAEDQLYCAPEFLQQYFDYEAFARDLKMEYTVLDLPDGQEAIFYA
ncbi:antirestriction protein ArdA [Paracoccus denitrificans]|uniref:antirestriction protein ArdA n=1 Tax=Paracoccus denitrificans TaxID=266 RepID=UPI001E3EFBB1|nr:antirestriction protein ArdA [Paracoccus denitrificans]UFS66926.1 antirestriction protein ArdA [Paracoccus denitrificans]